MWALYNTIRWWKRLRAFVSWIWPTLLMGSITQKGPLWPESLSYQKKDGRGHFLLVWRLLIRCFFEKQIDISFLFICSKSLCHTKERVGTAMRPHPSFGMTTAQAIRDRFAWRCEYNHPRQPPMGAGDCPWAGYTDWNVYIIYMKNIRLTYLPF